MKELNDFCKEHPPQSIEEMTRYFRVAAPFLIDEIKLSSKKPILASLIKK